VRYIKHILVSYILVLDLSADPLPFVVFEESSLWLLHVHSALFWVADVTNVDEVEAVPKQAHLPKGPLIHHPGCQPIYISTQIHNDGGGGQLLLQ
jgi:hypothetical protein